ncbi:hypothetical protein [Blastochloris sulfoviridis]|uniref:hypothetical protein n=1 Tax=Blastochloris sulfoviridis TaxID=50712 RepID=UPI0014781411|nr:hypothetical protein [Blastochloris sulfoviridis]
MSVAPTPADPPRAGTAFAARRTEASATSAVRDRQAAYLIATWLAASLHRISPAALERPRGERDIVLARQCAIYLVHVVFGFDRAATAALFHRDRRTVERACAHIEDLREDAATDRGFDALERRALALAASLGLEVRR